MAHAPKVGLATLLSALGFCDVAFAEEPTPPAPQPVRLARVAFEPNEQDAVLESEPADSDPKTTWEVTCKGPCDKHLPAERRFRVAGPGYYPSRPFMLPGERDRVVVDADMKGSSIAVPTALCVIGGSMFLVGSFLLSLGNYQFQQGEDAEGLSISGFAGMGGGAVVGATGVVILLVRTRTKESSVHVAKSGGGAVALDARGIVF